MRELFPFTFGHPPTWFAKATWTIVVNWRNIEIDPHAEERLPALIKIVGYRNAEVWNYLQLTADYRDTQLALDLYGSCKMQNEQLPERLRRPLSQDVIKALKPQLKLVENG